MDETFYLYYTEIMKILDNLDGFFQYCSEALYE